MNITETERFMTSRHSHSEISFRNLTAGDLPGIVHVHCQAFPDSALTALGKEAVRRYYDWQLHGPHEAIAIGGFVDGQCAGFCFGGRFRGALSGFLRQNRGYLIMRLLTHPWLLGRSAVRQQLPKRSRRKQFAPSPPLRPPDAPSCGILALAVSPAHQKQGLGRLLMQGMEAWAMQHGYSKMHLTVHPENQSAVAFYTRLGWQEIPSVGGEWRGAMTKAIAPAFGDSEASQP